jgi:type IV secretory pathway VirB2 component (pilin)
MILLILQSGGSLADPPDSSVIAPAVDWVQDALLGTVATSAAVIAVATIGLLMLSGRINARRGLVTIIGCFILFGAPAIARGFRSVGAETEITETEPPAPPPLIIPPAPAKLNAFDPYAGASFQH